MCTDALLVKKLLFLKGLTRQGRCVPALSHGIVMEKLLYFVGGIIVGSISTLAALGFTEEGLDELEHGYHQQENGENE